MNYLELGQRLAVECAAPNVTLTSMLGNPLLSEEQRFVNWINTAWNELQTLHDDWEWMRSSELLGQGVSFVPNPGQAVVPLGTGPGTVGLDPLLFGGKWAMNSFRNYATTAGKRSEIFMSRIMQYDYWRNAYMYGANRSVQTRPIAIAVAPDKSLCLGPPPNGQYTVTGDYYRAPAIMQADLDLPLGLPLQYHMGIVYKGMMYYASYEAAPEVLERGLDGFNGVLTELERQYGPRARLTGALA